MDDTVVTRFCIGVINIPAKSSNTVTFPLSAALTTVIPSSKTAMIHIAMNVRVLKNSFIYLEITLHSAGFSSDLPVPSATQSSGLSAM